MGVIQAVISRSIGSGQPLRCTLRQRTLQGVIASQLYNPSFYSCRRSIHAGDHVIVFVLKDPLYLVAVSNTGEPVEHLRRQLEHMYGCIMFILTDKVCCAVSVPRLPHAPVTTLTPWRATRVQIFSMLTNKPTYDVRTLLGGKSATCPVCILAFNVADNNTVLLVQSCSLLRHTRCAAWCHQARQPIAGHPV